MKNKLQIYNTLNRKKAKFEPINPSRVGMYVCGPTVYGAPHLGHARGTVCFDIIFRYLQHIGYKVRYVSNITDVGHLENDSDDGEDKIGKRAILEQLEPMEIVQKYTNIYHENMNTLNITRPSIQPHASGHIPEQLELIDKIYENGFAYESNGSVYFDVKKYSEKYEYGKLSGRTLENSLQSSDASLQGQSDKKNPYDFALWKKADPNHIMRWNSKWSVGFPGWHLECTAMGAKYLGEQFDIHGGGLDLKFPHHECEIAQAVAAYKKEAVNYWMHNNLITINGQKMSKSLNNFITLDELFSGDSELLEKAYSPMTIRFFILQSHYRSPIDFSNKALQSSEKGFMRLQKAIQILQNIKPEANSTINIDELENKCYNAINDDFNTPILIAHLFDGIKMINSISEGKEKISSKDLEKLQKLYNDFYFNILGLQIEDTNTQSDDNTTSELVDMLLNIRMQAKANKDWKTADEIRDKLKAIGFIVKDKKDGFEWEKVNK